MAGRVVAGPEPAGRLDDEVDVELGPRQGGRVVLLPQWNAGTAEPDAVVVVVDVVAQPAERRVVLEQVCQCAGVPQVVDADHRDRGVEQLPVDQASDVVPTDPAESVDGNAVSHVSSFGSPPASIRRGAGRQRRRTPRYRPMASAAPAPGCLPSTVTEGGGSP